MTATQAFAAALIASVGASLILATAIILAQLLRRPPAPDLAATVENDTRSGGDDDCWWIDPRYIDGVSSLLLAHGVTEYIDTHHVGARG